MVVIGGIVGMAYLSSLPRLYTASAFILVDNRRIRAVENAYDVNPAFDTAASYLVSQVEVIKSAQVAEVVVKRLKLLDGPQSASGSTPSIWSRICQQIAGLAGWLKPLLPNQRRQAPPAEGNAQKTQARRMIEAIAEVQSGLEVHNVSRTLVLQVSYTAAKPEAAAEMANAFAESYITDQLNAKFEATRRASKWLEARLAELKQKALDADLAVQKFKAENNLISSSGKLVNEQQLTELNTQLVIARSERARAEARHTRLKHIIDRHETQAIVSDALGNTIIEQLRTKYLDASKREAELTARVGPEHLSVVGLRNEMRQYERLIFSELSRMEEGYLSEVNIARAKELALSESLEKLIETAGKENKLLVTLHELEHEGESFRTLYKTYLQRYQESLQQQTFPIAEARVITPAFEPAGPSYPKKKVLMLLFLSLGGLLGACIAVFREFQERGFRNLEQLRNELGVDSLGIVPFIKVTPAQSGAGSSADASKDGESSSDDGRQNARRKNGRTVTIPHEAWNYALTHPNSALGETLLAAKLSADIRGGDEPCKVIGVMSALPNEGKTLFSKNFGSLLAARRTRVLLIDGDLRKVELSQALAPYATKGLLEVAIGEKPLGDVLYTEPRTGLSFLPTVSRHRITHSSDVLASPGMRRLLEEAKTQFDYIVIDLPPLGPVVDTRAIASQVHAFVLVVEWRRTPRSIVRDLLWEDARVSGKCLGVVLNKVDIAKIKLFEEHGSRLYHYEAYTKSYYFDK